MNLQLSSKQNVFILVGIPGSGKSSMVKKIKEYYKDLDFVVVNQDSLGSRDKCLDLIHTALESGKNVIIDRCNINKQQRKFWIDAANYYSVKNIYAIVLDTEPEEAIARIHLRKNHETIKEDLTLDEKRSIVYKFFNSAEIPSIQEGFTSVLILKG